MKTIGEDGKAHSISTAEFEAYLKDIRRQQMAAAMEAAALLPVPITADDMGGLLARYGDNGTRVLLFDCIVAKYPTTPEAYADGLRFAYTTANSPFGRDGTLRMFAAVKDRRLFMDEDELRDYDAMPDAVRVFRGCNRSELRRRVFGCSWTTRQDIAEFFAWRLNAQDSSRIVVATDIPKAAVLAYFNGRTEYEVIADIHGGSAQDYATIEQPTQLYWDYMGTPRY